MIVQYKKTNGTFGTKEAISPRIIDKLKNAIPPVEKEVATFKDKQAFANTVFEVVKEVANARGRELQVELRNQSAGYFITAYGSAYVKEIGSYKISIHDTINLPACDCHNNIIAIEMSQAMIPPRGSNVVNSVKLKNLNGDFGRLLETLSGFIDRLLNPHIRMD
ncbi:MAG: hypothetical protein NTV88_03680 [Candidatus Micrarchaeota archaeon]|nr:hypothetical protein [Candidatus Micrarchaeota archaeon]